MNRELEHRKERAKSCPICQILGAYGFSPVPGKENDRVAWYYSPLRERENTPSFMVDKVENEWSDFGLSPHREDSITLVMWYNNIGFLPAIEEIERIMGANPFIEKGAPRISVKRSETKASTSDRRIESVGELRDARLIDYLASRCIPLPVAREYCREVSYTSRGGRYIAIGFPNDRGGYALRSAPYKRNPKGFKGNIGPNGISTIRRVADVPATSILVFEGFFDFLSWVTLYGQPESDVIVLNSTSNVGCLDDYHPGQTLTLYCFLDTDSAGFSALAHLAGHSGCVVNDLSEIYRGKAKDLNEYLIMSSALDNQHIQ